MNITTRKRQPPPANIAVDLLLNGPGEQKAGKPFLDHAGRPAVIFWGNRRYETEHLESSRLAGWLEHRYFEKFRKPLPATCLSQAQSLMRASAISSRSRHPVYLRVAPTTTTVCHDLGTANGQLVYITPDRYSVVEERPIPFVRPAGMLELPVPEPGNRSLFDLVKELLQNLHDEQTAVICAWLVGVARGRGPFPVLVLCGEQGCGKSTLTHWLRDLIDPRIGGLRCLPRDERDLFIAAGSNYILAFDNVSSIPPWFSDSACRIASGGGYATRKLYSDMDEILFDVQRPIIFNGITNVVTRDDLRDRSLILSLPRITMRETEASLLQRYRRLRPQILAALYECVSVALRRTQ